MQFKTMKKADLSAPIMNMNNDLEIMEAGQTVQLRGAMDETVHGATNTRLIPTRMLQKTGHLGAAVLAVERLKEAVAALEKYTKDVNGYVINSAINSHGSSAQATVHIKGSDRNDGTERVRPSHREICNC